MAETIRYTYPWRIRIYAWAGCAVTGLLGLLLPLTMGALILFPIFIFFFLLCAWVIVLNSAALTAGEDGLTYHRLWRADVHLPWIAIQAIQARRILPGILLRGEGATPTIPIMPTLNGYTHLVERLLRERPELFQQVEFRLAGGISLASLALALVFAGLSLSSLVEGDWTTAAGTTVLVALVAWLYLDRPLGLRLETDGLRVRYLFVKRWIPLDQILTVRYPAENAQQRPRNLSVEVVQRGGKIIVLNGFGMGEVLLYGALRSWLEERGAERPLSSQPRDL